MKLNPVIDEIKLKGPTFANRVAGAAEYANLRNRSNMMVPAAYIVPLDDSAGTLSSQSGYRQTITDSFSVIVVISNLADERGQTAANQLHDLRAELWAALLGMEMDDYQQITYNGGNLLHVDRSRLDYQFDFSAEFYIDVSDTRKGVDQAALPAFTSIRINLDHNELPPDGTIDHTLDISVPQ